MKEKVIHPFKPLYNKDSKILILGSMPSVKSKELNFYYGNPKNLFWKLISDVLNENPNNNKEKINMLLKHNIALWDVIKECNIKGSDDSTITDVIPNDINQIIKNSNIKTIFTTGKKAYNLFNKYIKDIKIIPIYLPSSSPANCKMKYNELKKEYSKILEYL